MFVQIMLIHWRPLGQFVFPAQHRAGAHHQAESDSSSRIQPVHESRASHPHPGASPGNSVRSVSLQARRTGLLWNIWLHHAHIHALPGEITLLVLADWYLFIHEALTIFRRSHQWIPSYWLFNLRDLVDNIPFSRWLCLYWLWKEAGRKARIIWAEMAWNQFHVFQGVIWSSGSVPALSVLSNKHGNDCAHQNTFDLASLKAHEDC